MLLLLSSTACFDASLFPVAGGVASEPPAAEEGGRRNESPPVSMSPPPPSPSPSVSGARLSAKRAESSVADARTPTTAAASRRRGADQLPFMTHGGREASVLRWGTRLGWQPYTPAPVDVAPRPMRGDRPPLGVQNTHRPRTRSRRLPAHPAPPTPLLCRAAGRYQIVLHVANLGTMLAGQRRQCWYASGKCRHWPGGLRRVESRFDNLGLCPVTTRKGPVGGGALSAPSLVASKGSKGNEAFKRLNTKHV